MAATEESLEEIYDDGFGVLEPMDEAGSARAPVDPKAQKKLEKERKKQEKLARKQAAAAARGKAAATATQQMAMADIELGEQYEELDTYAVTAPFSYVRILFDKRDYSRLYYVVEPDISPAEQDDLDQIIDVLIRAFNISKENLDEDQEEFLKQATNDIINAYNLSVKNSNADKIHYYIKRDLLGYGKMDVMMHDANIEDVSCDGPGVELYVYHRRYESMRTNIVWTDEMELEQYIIRLAQRCGKHISVAEPLLDSTLMDGSRIVMTLGREVSTRGSTFTIRRFRDEPFTPVDLLDYKTFDAMQIAFLWLCIQYGMSMLFVGGTASGKTTSLNACALFMPWQHKIVSIEETRELNLPHPNWIPGVTRQGFGGESAGSGGKTLGEVDMYDLLRAALRERPEYIIVGEIRGAEAYVLFQAMATGHTTYSTFHADSVQSLVHRLENKPIDTPRVMIPALDAISIQVQTRVGGKRVRRAKAIVEIIGIDPNSKELLSNEVFRWVPAKDEMEFSGKSYMLEKIMMKANLNRVEVMDEMKRRQLVIEWTAKKNIRYYTDFARVIAEYYAHPEDVMRQVYADMQTSTRKVKARRRKVGPRKGREIGIPGATMPGSSFGGEGTGTPVSDLEGLLPADATKLAKMRELEAKRAEKSEARIQNMTDPTKQAQARQKEEQMRITKKEQLESFLLKAQARASQKGYSGLAGLKEQLSRLEIDLGVDLTYLDGNSILKFHNMLLQETKRRTQYQEKLTKNPDPTKQSAFRKKEQDRKEKFVLQLQQNIAKALDRVQKQMAQAGT